MNPILLVIVLLLLIGTLPAWPYSAGWGYYPSGILGTVLLVPGAPLSLVAGLVFGLGWGVLLVLVSATIGATLAFLVARSLER